MIILLPSENQYFDHLGVELLSEAFDARYLLSKLSRTRKPIKVAMMDQALVVGIGNIYASETLFRAQISPDKLSNQLTEEECKKIDSSCKECLI